MGRPAKFDKNAAIDTAMNAFWINGYGQNSTKALSAQLGITRSSFYNAFENREELFLKTLQRYFELSPDRAFAEATKGQSVRTVITTTFRAACAARAGDPQARGCLAVNAVAELCNINQKLGARVEQIFLSSIDRLEEMLGWGVEQGEIPATTDLHTLALALQTLLVGLNTMSKIIRDENEMWAMVQTSLAGLGLLADP